MLTAVLGLGQIGLLAAIALSWASKKFAVKIDIRESAINDVLPGANCGACGYPGCSGYAAAITSGQAPITLCLPGGSELVEQLAKIMHIEAQAAEPQIAVVRCGGDISHTTLKYRYLGLHDCNAANKIAGGPKECPRGCLGLESCVHACPFDAISMTAGGLAQIDRERCTGCGRCVSICPRHVIRLAPAASTVHVLCNSHDKGAVVRKYCDTGCIGCKICQKTVPEAFEINTFLAEVDYTHGDHAARAIDTCPTHCIVDFSSTMTEHLQDDPQRKDGVRCA
mgnify:CR=1 FL=1|jgi:electron transport complex protein RnfB